MVRTLSGELKAGKTHHQETQGSVGSNNNSKSQASQKVMKTGGVEKFLRTGTYLQVIDICGYGGTYIYRHATA